MIEHTFQVIPGIGINEEQSLWHLGIKSWHDILTISGHPNITKSQFKKLKKEIQEFDAHLQAKDYTFFLQNLPESLHWRLFPNLKDSTLYIDVEATGTNLDVDEITSIAAYDGEKIFYFIKDQNLEEFSSLLENYNAIATFDGNRFDLPILRKELNVFFPHVHFDLFTISRQIGLKGGLKQLESRLGIEREELKDIDGKSAIYLWQEYAETQDSMYLDTLVAYNIEDVLHLEKILTLFCEELRRKYRVPHKRLQYLKKPLPRPIVPVPEAIKYIKTKYYS